MAKVYFGPDVSFELKEGESVGSHRVNKLYDNYSFPEFNAPIYKSPEEYQKKAKKYHKDLEEWLAKDTKHHCIPYNDPEHKHYSGYGRLDKGWEIRQAEIDRLKQSLSNQQVDKLEKYAVLNIARQIYYSCYSSKFRSSFDDCIAAAEDIYKQQCLYIRGE